MNGKWLCCSVDLLDSNKLFPEVFGLLIATLGSSSLTEHHVYFGNSYPICRKMDNKTQWGKYQWTNGQLLAGLYWMDAFENNKWHHQFFEENVLLPHFHMDFHFYILLLKPVEQVLSFSRWLHLLLISYLCFDTGSVKKTTALSKDRSNLCHSSWLVISDQQTASLSEIKFRFITSSLEIHLSDVNLNVIQNQKPR